MFDLEIKCKCKVIFGSTMSESEGMLMTHIFGLFYSFFAYNRAELFGRRRKSFKIIRFFLRSRKGMVRSLKKISVLDHYQKIVICKVSAADFKISGHPQGLEKWSKTAIFK